MASATNEDKRSSVKKVAVVGAGVSGLAAAYKLKSHGLDVMVFEAEGRAGGKLRSVSNDGLIWDEGANTMTESEIEVRSLLDNLGLRKWQQFPISQNKRYIVRNGMPILIPTNPVALIKSNILSAQSKLQIIFEPFLWKKPNFSEVSNDYTQERIMVEIGSTCDYIISSSHQFSFLFLFILLFFLEVVEVIVLNMFIALKFALCFSTVLVDSLSVISGKRLLIISSIPLLRAQVVEILNHFLFGSIIAGAIKSKLSAKRTKSGETKGSSEKKKHQRGSFSFQGGMQTLTDMLCKELGKDELKLKSEVLSLSYNHDEKSAENWLVSYASSHDKHSQDFSFDAVIMTAPLCNVKEMKITKRGTPFPLDFLPEVNYLPLSVLITTFRKENVKRPLEGFGVLVPSKEQKNGLKTLGTLFSSMMFPDRAPSDLYLYTTFIGGSRNRELAKASTDELKQIVKSDLRQLLGAEGEPTYVNHFYWSKAFPLYGHNYDSVLEAIEKMEKNLPGFFYAGNHKGGLSVGKAIASGCKAADLAISYLDSSLSEDKMLKEQPSS